MKRQIQLTLVLSLLAISPLLAAGYRMPITFAGYTNRTEVLTNFPALVVLSNNVGGSGFDFAAQPFLSTNGWDLRMRDVADTTDLNYEIEVWNTNGPCYVWVQVPAMTGDGSGSILVKWGDAAFSSQLACTTNGAVWADEYRNVYHFGETSGNAADATANRYTATNANITYGPGRIGNSAVIDSESDNFRIAPVTNEVLSASLWYYYGGVGGDAWNTLLCKYGGSYHHLLINDGTKYIGTYNSGANPDSNPYALTVGNWYFLTVAMNGTGYKLYRDGGVLLVNATSFNNKDNNLSIISTFNGANQAANGNLDEVRIENVIRSTNWIWACWLNQASNAVFTACGPAAATVVGVPGIVNVGAANIQTNAADLIGNLITGAAPVTVVCYWGTNNGGIVASAWMTNTAMGTRSPGSITNSLSGLVSGQNYFFRYYATNSVGESWAGLTAFTTPGAPSVDNGGGAANVVRGAAQLRGTVLSGTPTPDVWIYWGTTDGGATPGSWAHAIALGQRSAGAFSANVTGLLPVQQYYYRCFASNSYSTAWASSSAGFVTTGPAGNGTFTFTGAGNWSDASKWDALPVNGDSVVIDGACTNDLTMPGLVNLVIKANRTLVVLYGTGNASNRYAGDTIALSGDLSVTGTLVVVGDPSPVARSGLVSVAAGATNVYGSGTLFTSQFSAGDGIAIGSIIGIVRAIINDTSLVFSCMNDYSWPVGHPSGANNVTPWFASGRGMCVRAGNVTVPAAGSIHANGRGFPSQSGPGAGMTSGNWGGTAAGAGYGGWGALKVDNQALGGEPYGSATAPYALGSGGGNTYNVPGTGGTGGGAIKVQATGVLTLNGTIAANGGAGSGGGSGGSVWLVADTLTGAGLVGATGGDGTGAAGGGGGRVMVAANNMPYTGAFNVAQGAGAPALPARPGTLLLPDNYGLTVTRNTALPPGTYHFPALIVTSNATLDCQSDNDGDPVNGAGVVIFANSVRVDAGAKISASSLGFVSNQGPGRGEPKNSYSGTGGGGGHGGAGTNGQEGAGGGTYGSSNQPVSIGSAGGGGSYGGTQTVAGPGGGAIKIKTTADVTLNGTISAAGGGPWTGNGGGGAGGSIWIDCRKLYGSGTNSANGGGAGGGGGGGGGRIAIYYIGDGYRFTGTNTVTGGTGFASLSGGVGTIYLKSLPVPGSVLLFQ